MVNWNIYFLQCRGDFNIFSGAMPRASFGDHNVVNVFQEDSHHVAFDFTSKVIDFFVMCSGGPGDGKFAELVIISDQDTRP